MTNVEKHMEKHGLTNEMLDEIARPYEDGTFEGEAETVYTGSHVEAVEGERDDADNTMS